MSTNLGTLYGISVGTGDPELITIKGLRLLQESPVVAYPKGIKNKLGFARQIIDRYLKPEQKTLSLDFSFVRDEAILKQAWQKSADRVWEYLKQGQDVAFACEGDVSFYSTFTYLASTLEERYPEINIKSVPGVSSPMASACELGIPLTFRNQKLAILPAIYESTFSELETALDFADVIVLMKFASIYPKIWQILKRRNLLAHSSIVSKATCEDKKIYKNLTNYPNLQLPYFSLLLISTSSVHE